MLLSAVMLAGEGFTMQTGHHECLQRGHTKQQKALISINEIVKKQRAASFTGTLEIRLHFGSGIPSSLEVVTNKDVIKL